MGKYELLYVVHPDLESSIDKITDRVRSYIEKRDGKITYEENWGKRKLAYEIKKNEVGIYILWYFEAPKENLTKIERDIRLTEEVMRYMLLSTQDKVKAAKKPAAKTQKPARSNDAEETSRGGEEKPTEEQKPAAKKTAAKKAAEKDEPARTEDHPGGEPTETEEERLKKLDEKLGAILGEEEGPKVKKEKIKSKKSEK